MNILPKSYSQFKDKSYWNNFFAQLKNTSQQNFQWYGNYFDFKEQLRKIFKHITHKNSELSKDRQQQSVTNQQLSKDKQQQQVTNSHQTPQQPSLSIFHIGCGKSTFGEDIQLQHPHFTVINTDYSEQVVKDMIKRSLILKTMCKYEVCDMFQPLQEKYRATFSVVLDKGTLDAILPEDKQEEVERVKQVFFGNVEQAMRQDQLAVYVVVSMLQPFVLRTLLEHFFTRAQFEIQIQQTRIKDSKMQPFLICIKRYPSHLPYQSKQISLKLLKGNKQLHFATIAQAMKRIEQLQETVVSQQKVKKLVPRQHLTYNISNPNNPEKMRYMVEIVDGEQGKLKENSCAVFITPQGKQTTYPFSTLKGLHRLSTQISTSRLILIKLLPGNTFKSIDQVKTELNPLIPNFIQQNCEVKNVPFMTDAEELGVRKVVYEDERVFVEEVLNGKEEAIRRVILKGNLGLVQTQFRLIYGQAAEHPQAKENQKKTKILPAKKGKYVVIDQQHIDQGYCQQVVTGLLRLTCLHKTTQKSQPPHILILGGGGYSIPKFLYETMTPKPRLTTVEKEKSLCGEECLEIFEVLEYAKKGEGFVVVNDDAQQYVLKGQHKEQYSAIVVDISGTQEEQLPPKQFLQANFVQKCSAMLSEKQGGVLVYNVLRKSFVRKDLQQMLTLKLFDLVYIAREQQQQEQQAQNKNKKDQQQEEQDCLVLFLVKLPEQLRSQAQGDTTKLALIGEELITNTTATKTSTTTKSKQKSKSSTFSHKLQLNIPNQEWVNQCLEQVSLIYPVNKTKLKI